MPQIAVEHLHEHDSYDESPDHRDSVETDDLFDPWFALAAQPAYVERIEGQMGFAWAGAQAFRAGAFSERYELRSRI